jgi:2-keto-3-deoxy-L-rhamnonate aldolase RhmA
MDLLKVIDELYAERNKLVALITALEKVQAKPATRKVRRPPATARKSLGAGAQGEILPTRSARKNAAH